MADGNSPINTTSVTIGGLQGYAQIADYTLSSIATDYQIYVLNIQRILQKSPPTMTTADAQELSSYVTILRDLLVNGETRPSNPSDPSSLPATSYMTSDMADQLKVLFAVLQQLNPPVNLTGTVSVSLQQLQALQTISSSTFVLRSLFEFAASFVATNNSIQTLVELNFVKTGNNLMADQMESLERALQTAQNTLNQLNSLQELHNQISVASKPPFPIPGGTFANPSAFMTAYNAAASAFFGTPIAPSTNILPLSGLIATIPPPTAGKTTVGIDQALTSTYNNLTSDMNLVSNSNVPGSEVFGARSIILAQRSGPGPYNLTQITWQNGQRVEIFLGSSNIGAPGVTQGDVIAFLPAANYSSTLDLVMGPVLRSATNLTITSLGLVIPNMYSITSPDAFYLSNSALLLNLQGDNFTLAPSMAGSDSYVGTKIPTIDPQLIVPRINDIANKLGYQTFFRSLGDHVGTFWVNFNTNTREFVFDSRSPSLAIDFMVQIGRVRTALAAQLQMLSGTVPRINKTASNPIGDEDPSGLTSRVRRVLQDLDENFGGPITSSTPLSIGVNGLRQWLIDGYNQTALSQAGQLQQHLTFALTAGQSLNDSQKQKVQQFLFIFQEYYNAASAILQQLTQVIQQMAKGIAQ